MINILIVEDDIEIQQMLRSFLKANDYNVIQAYDGLEAISRYKEADIALLDVMLPRIDGFSALELIRREADIPIIMITALDTEGDQLKAFDLGVDDYITKPFSAPILLRKIDAILRRTHKITKKVISYKDLEIDLEGMSVFVNNVNIKLTAKEYEILLELFAHPGIVISRDVLVTRIWGDETFCDDRIVNIHIKNIRQKLGVDYIETIRGVGYKVEKLH